MYKKTLLLLVSQNDIVDILNYQTLDENSWYQNAPVTVNSKTSAIPYNPSYYLTKHFSYDIKPRARRIGLDSTYSNAVAFEYPNSETIILIKNDNTSKQNNIITK